MLSTKGTSTSLRPLIGTGNHCTVFSNTNCRASLALIYLLPRNPAELRPSSQPPVRTLWRSPTSDPLNAPPLCDIALSKSPIPYCYLRPLDQDVYSCSTPPDARFQGWWQLPTLQLTRGQRRWLTSSKRMQTDPPAGVSASPVADNVMTW